MNGYEEEVQHVSWRVVVMESQVCAVQELGYGPEVGVRLSDSLEVMGTLDGRMEGYIPLIMDHCA